MRTYRVVAIPGDNIGPEILESSLRVLEAVQRVEGDFILKVERHDAGALYYQRHGVRIGEETLDACRQADGVLKAPVGDPSVRTPEGTEAGLLGGVLRIGLDTYANVRPVRLWAGLTSALRNFEPGQIDYVVVRENTEGLYVSRDKGVGNLHAMSDTLLMTRTGVERVCRFAFEYARKRGRGAPADEVKRVTCVEKSNVLKTYAFFRDIFFEVAAGYPDIEAETLHSDACAQALILQPGRFNVLVMENFLGDLLSDLGAATVGGLGMCPSGNIGEKHSYFEPVHGSAPDIAGKGIANPLSQIFSATMLLEHMGEVAAARRVERAVWEALKAGGVRLDSRGRALEGTNAITEAVTSRI
jgi:3-isopropylmalate dehydrogenase